MCPQFFQIKQVSFYSFRVVFRPLLLCPPVACHNSYYEQLSTFNLIQIHFHFLTQPTSSRLFPEFWNIDGFQTPIQGQLLKYKTLSLFLIKNIQSDS